MTSVRVEKLVVAYEANTILKGVDVEIRDGEFFFLLGPSGCGKTTLLRSIAGFIEPASGDIRFGTQSMKGVPAAKRDCGMVFQNYALWPHLTVAQNVAFGLDVRKVEKAEKERRVREALELVRMEEFADRPPGRLSGGQQQRVALARAIVVRPQILLLDEPLSNLDAKLRVDLRVEIREIQKRTKRTAIYVTHDRAEALALADRIAVMRGGIIEQLGSPREIYDAPTSPFVASFVGDINALDEGRVVGRTQEGVEVEGPYGRVVARACGKQKLPDSNVRVYLRPERIRLEGKAASSDSSTGADRRTHRLSGRVKSVTFLGEFQQYEVEVGGTIVRTLALSGSPTLEEGENVSVIVEDALAYGPEDFRDDGTRNER